LFAALCRDLSRRLGEQDRLRRFSESFGRAVQWARSLKPMVLQHVDDVRGVVAVIRHGHRVPVGAGALHAFSMAGLEGRQ
jgi:hypothetical protein